MIVREMEKPTTNRSCLLMQVREYSDEEKGRSYEWRDRAMRIPSRRSKKLLSARDERERADVVPGRRDREQVKGQKKRGRERESSGGVAECNDAVSRERRG
jgi:hypothetical protein